LRARARTLSVLDALEVGRAMHSWSLEASLRHMDAQGRGVVVLLNCGESAEQLLGAPRRMPSMTGYGLEVSGFLNKGH